MSEHNYPRTEAELSTIKLNSDEAVERTRPHEAGTESSVTAATRSSEQEIVAPEGRSVVVTAPVAGTFSWFLARGQASGPSG